MSKTKKRKQEILPKSDPDEKVKKKPKTSEAVKQPETSQQQTTTSKRAAKPIFVAANFQVTKNALLNLTLKSNPVFRIRSASQTQVSCQDSSDKQRVAEALKAHNIAFHTFAEPADKPLRFILKGFYETSPEEVMKLLVAMKLPVLRTSVLFSNPNCTFYMVQFKSDGAVNAAILNRSARLLDDILVRWEPYKNSQPHHIQCRNCQRWGHSASYCGHNYRCVKCNGEHAVGECPRTNREGLPTCINCGGSHAANHRGCETYKAYEARANAQKAKQTKTKTIIQRVMQDDEFPALPAAHSNKNPIQKVSNVPTFAAKIRENVNVSSQIQDKSVQNRLIKIQNDLISSPMANKIVEILEKLVISFNKLSSQTEDYDFDIVIRKSGDLEAMNDS
jgi:hypothetical protein